MSNAVVGSLRVNLGIDTAQFREGIKAVSANMKKLAAGMAKVGAGLTVAGAAVAVSVKRQIDAADDLSKQASKFGIPIESLSRLKYAADLSDVSMETLGASVGKLSKSMAAAAGGNKAATKMFSDLGIAITDTKGQLRPVEAVLGDVADKMAAMPDGAAKTAMAMQLMGRGGAEMIPLLNSGKGALEEMAAEADRLGLTVSAATGKSAEAFNDNMTKLGAAVTGLSTRMAAGLAPLLEKISGFAVEMVKYFDTLSPSMQTFLSVIGGVSLAAGPAIAALGLLALGIGAVGWPVAGVVALIAALTAGVVAFWPEIKQAYAAVVDFWQRGLNGLKQVLADAGAWFDGVKQAVSTFVTSTLQSLQEKLVAAKQWFIDLGNSLRAFVSDAIGKLVEGFNRAKDAVIAFGKDALEWIMGLPAKVAEAFAGLGQKLYAAGVEAIQGFLDGMKAKWAEAKAWLANEVQNTQSSLQEGSLLDRARDAISGRNVQGSGGEMAAGLAQGMNDGAAAVAAAGAGLAATAQAATEKEADIQSPSRVFARIGAFMSQGLAQGITSAAGSPMAALKDMAANLAGSGALSSLSESFGKVGDGLKGMAKDVLSGTTSIKDAVFDMVDKLKEKLFDSGFDALWSGLGSLLGGGGDPLAAALSAIPGFANGVSGFGGGLAMVGERGRELVSMPAGSRVFSNPETEAMLRGGGGQAVDVRVSVDDEGALRAYVARTTERTVQAAAPSIVRRSVAATYSANDEIPLV